MPFNTDRFLRIAAASPVLQRNIVQVAELAGVQVHYLGEHVGREAFASTARPGNTRDAAVTAIGLAALAGLNADQAHDVIAGLPTELQERTQEAVVAARVRGYAVDRGRVHPSVYGLAIPVSSFPGVAVGVPLVEVLPDRWQEDARRYQEVVSALRSAVRVLQPD